MGNAILIYHLSLIITHYPLDIVVVKDAGRLEADSREPKADDPSELLMDKGINSS